MADIIRIEDIAQHVGQEVTLQGWLYDKTDKGKLSFLQVRDGTGIVQAVVFAKDVPPELFDLSKRVPQESSIVVTGSVRADARAPGVPGGFDIVLGGRSRDDDGEKDRALVRALAEAGATWWVEYIPPDTGGIEEIRSAIERGSLRID